MRVTKTNDFRLFLLKIIVIAVYTAKECTEYAKYVNENVYEDSITHGQNISSDNKQFIVGPAEIATSREFPHMVFIGHNLDGNFSQCFCGGSLISEYFVLTAAHCIHFRNTEATYIRVGKFSLFTNKADSSLLSQKFTVTRTFVYPNYNPPSHYNDIALLRTDRQVLFDSYVRPACLPVSPVVCTENYTATKWRKIELGSTAINKLFKVKLMHLPHTECNSSYSNNISRKLRQGIVNSTQICAVSTLNGADTCQGDSGGPLQITNNHEPHYTFTIIGVTSFGKACDTANVPGVYTRVSYYLEWIENIVWP